MGKKSRVAAVSAVLDPNKVSIAIPSASAMKSLADIGYQAARVANEAWSPVMLALTARGIDASGDLPDDVKTELTSGIVLRKHEIEGSYWAKREGKDNYVSVTRDRADAKEGDWEEFNVHMSLAVTTHELGEMRKTSPNRYERIKRLREAAQKFASNTLGALRRAASKAKDAGGRGATKAFNVWLDDVLKSMVKKAKSAAQRNDGTAMDEALLKRKIKAFNDAV